MKYTQIPTTTFQNLQLNAGILVDSFTPATGTIGNIIGATTGGIQFSDTPTYKDFGEDIDNCPKNMKELKHIESREVKMSGTFISITPDIAKLLSGSADVDPEDLTHIIPRSDILDTDFTDIWWIGDYSDINDDSGDDASAGFLAIKMLNVLNTSGFNLQTADKNKGQFSFEFTGHYSMDAQTVVPYEIYIQQGAAEVIPTVNLNKHYLLLTVGGSAILTASVVPANATVNWGTGNGSVATVSSGTVTAAGAGNTIITASITINGVTYNDTCTVVVEAAS